MLCPHIRLDGLLVKDIRLFDSPVFFHTFQRTQERIIRVIPEHTAILCARQIPICFHIRIVDLI